MKGKIILYAFVFTALVGLAVFWGVKNAEKKEKQAGEKQIQEVQSAEAQQIDTSDWQTYRNEEYGFEIRYPEDWVYVEFYYKNENVGDGLKIIPKNCWEEDETGHYCDIHVGVSVYRKLRGASLFKGNHEEIERSKSTSNICRNDVQIPSLKLSNESINVEKCYSNSWGHNWNIYYFIENNIGYELILMHIDPLYNPKKEKAILETFKLLNISS